MRHETRTTLTTLLLASLLASVLAFGTSDVVQAEMCKLDNVPAATLLLPYFEVPLVDDGSLTLITLHNATPEPTLLHVTFWTDWGVASIDWDLYLTGYDMEVVNLTDAFLNGNLSITADDQSDPDDTISPAGNPAWDGDLQDCNNFFPFYNNPLITGSNFSRIRDGHTGQPVPSAGGNCFGSPSPGVAKGYITFDVSRRCSVEFPYEIGYFDGLDPVAIFENRVFGDVTYLRTVEGLRVSSYTLPLVHVEADESFDSNSTVSGATFYGRYAPGGQDHREPLGAIWDVPVHDNDRITSVRAWRGGGTDDEPILGYSCGVGPGVPIDHQEILCWNDQEDVVEICAAGDCFDTETQSVAVDSLSLPWASGWCRLDLRSSEATPSQSWVTVSTRLSEGDGPVSNLPGVSVGGACNQLPLP